MTCICWNADMAKNMIWSMSNILVLWFGCPIIMLLTWLMLLKDSHLRLKNGNDVLTSLPSFGLKHDRGGSHLDNISEDLCFSSCVSLLHAWLVSVEKMWGGDIVGNLSVDDFKLGNLYEYLSNSSIECVFEEWISKGRFEGEASGKSRASACCKKSWLLLLESFSIPWETEFSIK